MSNLLPCTQWAPCHGLVQHWEPTSTGPQFSESSGRRQSALGKDSGSLRGGGDGVMGGFRAMQAPAMQDHETALTLYRLLGLGHVPSTALHCHIHAGEPLHWE